ncbi:MAG: hypothetical protein KGS45_10625 [Planctomycetes bacterium]|nr:hypothetical protein [Planctomycetota bacterium]
MKNALSILAVAGFAAAAFAAPQETASFTSIDSNGPNGSVANTVTNYTATGGYSLGKMVTNGTLNSVNPATYSLEARIQVTPAGGQPSFIIQPFTNFAFSQEIAVDFQTTVPSGGYNPAGSWEFRFFESFDDGGTASIDANWESVSLTFDNDVPPPPPGPGDAILINLVFGTEVSGDGNIAAAGEVSWFKFALAEDVTADNNRFVDMTTIGGGLGDPEIGVYRNDGTLVANDDDGGPGLSSQLSFGTGGRPANADGLPFNGQNGALNATGSGEFYYIACAAFNTTFGATDFNVTSTGAATGATRVNVKWGRAVCRPDYNADGIVDFFDYLDFVQDFAAGCD